MADRDWIERAFWCALSLPVYSYALYPLLIVTLSFLLRRYAPPRAGDSPGMSAAEFPPVAIVVSAYNEECHIAELVSSLRNLDYPAAVTCYLGSDGSSDRTAQILHEQADRRMLVFAFPRNRGKASVLNDLLAECTEPIVVFTDANTQLERTALRNLVRHFADPAVGAVCGELRLSSAAGGDNVDGVYWRIERALKISESRLGGLLGANGALYAIRRECYRPIAPDTVTDDFCIAMTVAAAGWRLVYESEARAVEVQPSRLADEFQRRVRIGVGNYQAFFRHPEYLFGISLTTGFAYFSHKVLRWFTPHLLSLALILNALLLDIRGYLVLWLSQLFAYGLSLLLLSTSGGRRIPKWLRLPVFLVSLNMAFGIGFCRYLTGRYSGSWKRTARA
jgi:cellulose synthase/poly-beta-1,6-N-acetylglucosamine synthase-like glycosyltransferase